MGFDRDLIVHKLQRWDHFISNYRLPEWDSIPNFGLYMDQVIILLEEYLTFIPPSNTGKERLITSATINNYVRLKIMPAPVKKKYYRPHIAYLIMILTMKQSLSISDVQQIIPANLSEDDVRRVYQCYSEQFRQVALFFVKQVADVSADICNPDVVDGSGAVERLVIESALIAGFSKILAEKLLQLSGSDPAVILSDEIPGE